MPEVTAGGTTTPLAIVIFAVRISGERSVASVASHLRLVTCEPISLATTFFAAGITNDGTAVSEPSVLIVTSCWTKVLPLSVQICWSMVAPLYWIKVPLKPAQLRPSTNVKDGGFRLQTLGHFMVAVYGSEAPDETTLPS